VLIIDQGLNTIVLSVSLTIYAIFFNEVDGTLESDYSKLDLCPFIRPTSLCASHRVHQPHLLLIAPSASNSDNPVTNRKIHNLHVPVCDFFMLWPKSYGSLPPVVFCGFLCFFSLLFYFPCILWSQPIRLKM
jgi:hypothetical protein